MPFPLPLNEQQRLKSLELLHIFDTDAEQEFDDLTRIAAQVCEAPISAVSLIDADRQWFKSKVGLEVNETPREAAFCAHTILGDEVLIVPNACEDERFAENPLVTGDPNIRFYAGVPLITDDGAALGSLCVIDRVPRQLRSEQKEMLQALARQAMKLLNLRQQAGELALANKELNREIAERAKVEKVLRLRDQAIAAFSEGILITENEPTGNKIIYANAAFERMTGYTFEEISGRNCRFLQGAETNPATVAVMRDAIKEGKFCAVEILNYRKDGTPFWNALSISPVKDEFGKVTHYVGVQQDITARKQAEEKLQASEQSYRFLSETVPQQVWTALSDGNLDYVNERALRYFGLSKATAPLNSNWLSAVYPDDLVESTDRWKRSLETGEPYETEFRLRRNDGEYRWHLAQAVAMRDEKGKIIKWFGTNTDIHERKSTEEALRKSKEYRNLFQHANDAILIFDLESEIVIDVNERACEMYGIVQDDFIGKSIKEMSQNVDRGEQQLRILREKGINQSFETVQFHADGTPIHLLINSSIIDYRGEQVVLSINHDMTERKQAAAALLESEDHLRQSQKMEAIGTLTSGVAHDFNNLLTAIIGNAQLALRKMPTGDPMHNRLTEIEIAGNRASLLTHQLLAFSRRQRLDRHVIDLNQTITETTKLLKSIIGEDVEIIVKPALDLEAVFADPAQIEQVVMNLSVNARDAMPNGGNLTIETDNVELDENYCRRYPYIKPGKYVLMKVSDSGTGIDEQTQTRIFEPYFTTKEVGKGTGLGLSMIYGIIKQHDGYINLNSQIGQGTTFRVFLPVAEQVVKEIKQSPQLSLIGGSETILVAEDEEPLRKLTKDILESLGYTVLLAGNGEEAVRIFTANREKINMLLFDVVMPRGSGSDAYRQIRELKGGDVPLIFMTGYSSEMVQNRFVKQDKSIENLKVSVLQKPYTVEALGIKIRELLDSRLKS